MRTKNVTRNLRVTLESHEIDARATRAAQAWQEAHNLSASLKEHVKGEKSRIGRLLAEHDLLQEVVRERAEEREVPCVDQYDDDLGMVYTVRADTGEQVDERRMSEEDRQTDLLEASQEANDEDGEE